MDLETVFLDEPNDQRWLRALPIHARWTEGLPAARLCGGERHAQRHVRRRRPASRATHNPLPLHFPPAPLSLL